MKRFAALAVTVTAGRALRVRLSVAPRSRYWRDRAATARGEHLTLVALGDSLTQGIGASRPRTSWLARFVTHLESTREHRVHIDNRAVYGAKVSDVLIHQLPLPSDTDLVTLCIGANDAGRTPPEAFRAQLRRVCDQLPAGSIVGDVPEFQWGPRIAAAATLSRVAREVVNEYPGLVLAEVERHTTGTKVLTELAGDFFHPGDRGYARIAAAFIEAGP